MAEEEPRPRLHRPVATLCTSLPSELGKIFPRLKYVELGGDIQMIDDDDDDDG